MTSDGSDGGPVAEEARRLADAVSAWATSSTHGGQHAEHDAGHDRSGDSGRPGCHCAGSDAVETVCGVCPVCRAAGLVAAVRPEVIERVADVLTLVAGSLQAVADDRRRAQSESSDEQTTSRGEDA